MTAALNGNPFRRFWSWLTEPPDEILADAARDGELLVARLRVFITFLMLLSPVLGLLIDRDPGQNIIGVVISLTAIVIAFVLAAVVRRTPYSAQVSVASAIIDVSIVSGGLLAYYFAGQPIVATNSRVIFECYFLAIGASALRYDARVTAMAGAAAVVEHAGLSWLVWQSADRTVARANGYGDFSWSSQVSRGIVLIAMTCVALELVRRAQRLRRLSTGDRLTGLYNRAYVEEYLTSEVLRTGRNQSALVVGLLDVDNFKAFNDTHGHAAGDAALKHVAQALRSRLRRSDVIARYGGEEFLIVLAGTSAQRGVEKLEELRIDIGVHEVTLPRGGRGKLTVSIGVAVSGEDGRTVDQLLDAADARLYEAKHAGRNRVVGPPVDSPAPVVLKLTS